MTEDCWKAFDAAAVAEDLAAFEVDDKVGDAHLAGFSDEHIVGLDVSMHDTLPVQVGQGVELSLIFKFKRSGNDKRQAYILCQRNGQSRFMSRLIFFLKQFDFVLCLRIQVAVYAFKTAIDLVFIYIFFNIFYRFCPGLRHDLADLSSEILPHLPVGEVDVGSKVIA